MATWFSYQIETSRLALASLTTTRFQNMLKSQQRLVESQIYSQLWVVFQNEITVQNQITSRFGTKWDCFCPDLYLYRSGVQTNSYIVQYLQVFKYVLFGRADYDWFLTPNSSLMVNKSCIHTQIFSLFINDEIMYSHANLFIIHQWCKGMKISFHISLSSTSWGIIQIPIRSFSLTVLEPLHPPSGCPLPARYSIETHIKTVKR